MKSRSEVIRVAQSQRLLVWAILSGILLMFLMVGWSIVLDLDSQRAIPPAVVPLLANGVRALPFLVLAFLVLAGVKMDLALKYGWQSIFLILTVCVPCTSIFSLIALNREATKLLQACGIQVGLLWAKQADLDRYHPSGIACPACGAQLEAGESLCPLCGYTPPTVTL